MQRHDVRSVSSPNRSGRLLTIGSPDQKWCSPALPDRAIAHTIVSQMHSSAVALDRQPCDLFKRGRCRHRGLIQIGFRSCALPLTMTTDAL